MESIYNKKKQSGSLKDSAVETISAQSENVSTISIPSSSCALHQNFIHTFVLTYTCNLICETVKAVGVVRSHRNQPEGSVGVLPGATVRK